MGAGRGRSWRTWGTTIRSDSGRPETAHLHAWELRSISCGTCLPLRPTCLGCRRTCPGDVRRYPGLVRRSRRLRRRRTRCVRRSRALVRPFPGCRRTGRGHGGTHSGCVLTYRGYVRRSVALRATHPRHVARHPRHAGPCPGAASTLEGLVGTHLERAASSTSHEPAHPDLAPSRAGGRATHRFRRRPRCFRALTRRGRVVT
jgi:hypothetical protein